MSLCGLAYSPALQKREATPLSAVLRVINHTAILIYVPLLVALPFILGGKNITLAQLWKALDAVCHMRIAF